MRKNTAIEHRNKLVI